MTTIEEICPDIEFLLKKHSYWNNLLEYWTKKHPTSSYELKIELNRTDNTGKIIITCKKK